MMKNLKLLADIHEGEARISDEVVEEMVLVGRILRNPQNEMVFEDNGYIGWK